MLRLLALRPKGLVLPFIHDSMVRAFRSLGAEVIELPVPQGEEEFQVFAKKIPIDIHAVFLLDLGVDSFFISRMKELQISLKLPWIIWFVDDPEGYGFPGACQPQWTLAFCWDKEICRQFNQGSPWKERPLLYLPLATDPSVFFIEDHPSSLCCPGGVFVGSRAHGNELLNKIADTTPGFHKEVEALWMLYRGDFQQELYDLAWNRLADKLSVARVLIEKDPLARLWVQACVYSVGIRKRREVVTQALGGGGGVFGDESWAGILGDGVYKGRVAYGNELRKVYNKSAFVLEVRQPQNRTGLTQRIFDASACGRPVLAEWSPEIAYLFNDKEDILCFQNLEEAREGRERYLRNPEDAREKGDRARQSVLAHHTFRHRASEILHLLRRF